MELIVSPNGEMSNKLITKSTVQNKEVDNFLRNVASRSWMVASQRKIGMAKKRIL
jgi:hypothetical protein